MAIAIERLKEVVDEAGLKFEEQAAFYKVSASDGLALYISKTKKVSRVDISGFSFSHPAVTRLSENEAKEKRIGRVRGQINFAKSEEQVMEAFSTAVGLLKHLAGASVKELGKYAKFVKGVTPTIVEDNRGGRGAEGKETEGKRGRKAKPAEETAAS